MARLPSKAYLEWTRHGTLPNSDAILSEKEAEMTAGPLILVSALAEVTVYRGTSPIRRHPPPWDPPRTLGIGLR